VKAGHATKVAAVATAVIAVVYVVGVTVLNLVVSAHLAEQSDDRLAARLTPARHDPARLSQPVTRAGAGAGLGLAIGDSIVPWTGGRWHVGDSPLGGALMEVSWRPSQPHRLAAQRVTASDAR
jgi:hypothetical protein